MYRPVHGTIRQTRMQGIGNRPPSDPHDIISMHSGSEEEALFAQRRHIVTLIENARKDEIEAIKKYEYLIGEIMKYRDSIPSAVSVSDIFTAIKDQEKHHKALIERVQLNIFR